MIPSLDFSIVIPTYNRADFIGKTLLSLLGQDFIGFEIIVVDDGSTDETEKVVLSFADQRVRYVKKVNGERGAARNYGTIRSSGAYINFFDSDDLAYTQHLSMASKAIKRLNYPEVFHLGYDVKDLNGKLEVRRHHLEATINDALIDGNHLSCNSVFVRRDVALANPFCEDRVLSGSEDYELWLRLASRYKFHSDPAVTTALVNHEERSVLKINEEMLVGRIDALVSHLTMDEPFVRVFMNRIRLFRAYLNIYIGLHLALAHQPVKRSMVYLVRAVKESPRILFTRRFMAALKNTFL